MRVGLFGGTFDPIHTGHLIVAENARTCLGLDEVLFVPAGQPWLSKHENITEAHHRMAMVQLAIEANPYFRASSIEIDRPGPTYTVDTLVELHNEHGTDSELHVILGMDSLAALDKWHEPERVLELGIVVGIPRLDHNEFDPESLDAIAAGASAKFKILDGALIGISGTDVRRRVYEGLSIRYSVPESVESYIYCHGLYGARSRFKGPHDAREP